ncbi:glycosyl hydrolase [Talaromyces proteolyticus]|uniref:Glycosyl hydrolase n=1 Tax=Talaromyces proteolyticus TaxID=1131652 RepID=A0AAD4KX23_9EURO|nr:glycosyl hydrolase [Talaromyces proteolyticus]KAH8697869.1 glycosyl hydrolase [Talaromyces proteolyticus]
MLSGNGVDVSARSSVLNNKLYPILSDMWEMLCPSKVTIILKYSHFFCFFFSGGRSARSCYPAISSEQLADVNNVKLSWDIANTNAGSYIVQRRLERSTDFSTIANVSGNTYDDYNLAITQYVYRVTSAQNTSNEVYITTFSPKEAEYAIYDNTQVSSYLGKSNIKAHGLYYRYNYIENGTGTFYIQEQSSRDGYNFNEDRVVITSQTICASIEGSLCHLERATFNQNPDTGEVVMWAHLENAINYDLAQVACASGRPNSNWSFHGAYRPLGYDSRDMTVFVDNDPAMSAYLISAVGVNTNMTVIQLTSNWTAVDKLVNTVYVNQYREAPAMVKVDETYYLFTSRAAGWYPSQPLYITSKSIPSAWSEAREPADAATYGSQSGVINKVGNSYAMLSDRWGASWSPVDGENRQYMLPISFAPNDEGSAYYKFYQKTGYLLPGFANSNKVGVFGIQSGKILSVGKSVTPNPPGGTNITYVNDGIYDDPSAYFVPSGYPFTLTVDLGDSLKITQVDLTTRMVQGSETYYQLTVMGSVDGTSYEDIGDASNNTQVGYIPNFVASERSYRYVQVNVSHIINTHNGHEAEYFGGVIEYTVYGY